MCVDRSSNLWPPGTWNARVQNTWFCWPPVFIEVAKLFRAKQLLPPPGNVVKASEICALFQAAYGANFKPYYMAWRRNFGYGTVDPSNLCGASTNFATSANWIFTAFQITGQYDISPVKPPGCSCCPGGYKGDTPP